MSRHWFRQLREQLLGGPSPSRPARRRPARPAVECLERRELLSTTPGLIGGGLVGDPPDPGNKPPINPIHSTVVREDALTSLSAIQWEMNQPYSGTIANFGSAQAVLRSVSGLPTGLSATKSGSTILISGTPTQSGPFSIGVETLDEVINSNGVTYDTWYEGSYSLTINPALTLGSLSSAAWTAGQAGSATVAVSSGMPAYSHMTVTGLPPGLTATLSSGAVTISGTPTQAGAFSNIVVSLQDGIGATAQRTYSMSG
jgi:hypothetical protein